VTREGWEGWAQHVDWAADNPIKRTARKMVTMVQTINKDNFNGRQVVTCYTCHRGGRRPVTLPSIDLLYGTPPPVEPGANTAQMRLGSDWLAQLAARESAASRGRFICFWGHCDNIVFPTRSATLAGADNRHLPATPHVQMVEHPAVVEEVLRIVATTS